MENKRYTVKSWEDIKNMEPRKKLAVIEGKQICVKIGYLYYWIYLDRCNTKGKILQWAHHLLHKEICPKDAIIDFIEVTTKYHNLDLYRPDA